MSWSYRNDRADEVYAEVSGPALIQSETITGPPTPKPPVETSSNLNVSGAGSAVANGAYAYDGPNRWAKSSGLFEVVRSTQYPEPGVPWWNIRQDANVLYQAPDCPFPWDAVWTESSFGSSPVPTVEEIKQQRT